MSRFARRVDANQAVIVAALKRVGATVHHIHEVGRGCPDLIVGFRRRNYLLEVKNPRSGYGRRGVRHQLEQMFWHAGWAGQVCVVTSPEEALTAIGITGRES